MQGAINPDNIRVRARDVGVLDVRSRHVTLSCLGGAYFVYESRPKSDQTKNSCFSFRLQTLEPDIQNCENRQRCSRVLYLQEVSDLQLATNIILATAFQEVNGEGSDTTVVRVWNTVRTSLDDQTLHRQSIWEARI